MNTETETETETETLDYWPALDHGDVQAAMQRTAEDWFARAALGPPPPPIGKHFQPCIAERPVPSQVMLAYLHGVPAGMASWYPEGGVDKRTTPPDAGEVFVFPEFRHHGLGKALLGVLLSMGMKLENQVYSTGGLALVRSFYNEVIS